VPGESALFLLEKHTNFIKGIFVPTSTSKRLIVSNIWQRGELCAFPSQIKFGLFCRMPPFRKHSYIAPEFLKNMKCKGKFLDHKRTELLIQAFKENAYRMALEKHVFSAQTLQREQAAEQYKRMIVAQTQQKQKTNTYHKMKDQISNLQDEIELLRGERYLYEVARENLNEERLRLHDLSLSNQTGSNSLPITIRRATASHDHSAATTESAAGRTVSRSPAIDLAARKKKMAVDDGVNVIAEGIDRLTTKKNPKAQAAAAVPEDSKPAEKHMPKVDVLPPYEPHQHQYGQVEYNPYLEPNPAIDLSYPYPGEYEIPQARALPMEYRRELHRATPVRYGPAEYLPEQLHGHMAPYHLAPTPGLPVYPPEYHHYPLRVDSPFYPSQPRGHHLVGYPTHI